ncbi:hypothetical protein OJAV_G00230710 [Oryzias javanicus]|uniref:Ig-like domain-containing protein n=1 Tax=Oryzias javanicus TaxID=123683 RepID=A0A3S2LXL4_ORYJA|nr:hypothetical protein OJAV_G00230710 [Oryzias javanicus]
MRGILGNISYPHSISGNTWINQANISTVCSPLSDGYQCRCEDQYQWSCDQCQMYGACDQISEDSCGCIKAIPSDGNFCQSVDQHNFTVCPLSTATSTLSTFSPSLITEIVTTSPDLTTTSTERPPTYTYLISVELNTTVLTAVNTMRSILGNITYPLSINKQTQVNQANISTVCSPFSDGYQCRCEDQYQWSCDQCHMYGACDQISEDSCGCIKAIPSDGNFCQSVDQHNFSVCSTTTHFPPTTSNPPPAYKYVISVELNMTDLTTVNWLKSILGNVSYPISINGTTWINQANISTVCSPVSDGYQCRCEDQYQWSCDQCQMYGACDQISEDSCGCIKAIPSDGNFCQSVDQYNFTVCPLSTATSTLSTFSPSLTTEIITTSPDLTTPMTEPPPTYKYLISVELNTTVLTAVNTMRSILGNITYPFSINKQTQVNQANVSTVCSPVSDGYQCRCEDQYQWSCDQCQMYGACDQISEDSCGCIKAIPSDGNFCQSEDQYNFTLCPTTSTPSTFTTYFSSTPTEFFTTTADVTTPMTEPPPTYKYLISVELNTTVLTAVNMMRSILGNITYPFSINKQTQVNQANISTVCSPVSDGYQCRCEDQYQWSCDQCQMYGACDQISEDSCGCIKAIPSDGNFCQSVDQYNFTVCPPTPSPSPFSTYSPSVSTEMFTTTVDVTTITEPPPLYKYAVSVELNTTDVMVINMLRNILENISYPLSINIQTKINHANISTVCSPVSDGYQCRCEDQYQWSCDQCQMYGACDQISEDSCGCIKAIPSDGNFCQSVDQHNFTVCPPTPSPSPFSTYSPSVSTEMFTTTVDVTTITAEPPPLYKYAVSVELNTTDLMVINMLRNILENISYPLSINIQTKINYANISTVCSPVSDGYQCRCEDQYQWSCDQCQMYGACDQISEDSCGCIKAIPSDGNFCQSVDQYNFTVCAPTPTPSALPTYSPSVTTEIFTTVPDETTALTEISTTMAEVTSLPTDSPSVTTKVDTTIVDVTTTMTAEPPPLYKYAVSVELNTTDVMVINTLRNILENISYPLSINIQTKINYANISTVCSPVSDGYQCRCEDQYQWSCDQCQMYGACDQISEDSCGCIKAIPSDGNFCQSVDQHNFTVCPPTPPPSTVSTYFISTDSPSVSTETFTTTVDATTITDISSVPTEIFTTVPDMTTIMTDSPSVTTEIFTTTADMTTPTTESPSVTTKIFTTTADVTSTMTELPLPVYNYRVSVELNTTEMTVIDKLRSILGNITYLPSVSRLIQISWANISTVCSPVSDGYQCRCQDQYRWSCDQCQTYGACDQISEDSCGCVNAIPPGGAFCQPLNQLNLTACPVETTTPSTSTAWTSQSFTTPGAISMTSVNTTETTNSSTSPIISPTPTTGVSTLIYTTTEEPTTASSTVTLATREETTATMSTVSPTIMETTAEVSTVISTTTEQQTAPVSTVAATPTKETTAGSTVIPSTAKTETSSVTIVFPISTEATTNAVSTGSSSTSEEPTTAVSTGMTTTTEASTFTSTTETQTSPLTNLIPTTVRLTTLAPTVISTTNEETTAGSTVLLTTQGLSTADSTLIPTTDRPTTAAPTVIPTTNEETTAVSTGMTTTTEASTFTSTTETQTSPLTTLIPITVRLTTLAPTVITTTNEETTEVSTVFLTNEGPSTADSTLIPTTDRPTTAAPTVIPTTNEETTTGVSKAIDIAVSVTFDMVFKKEFEDKSSAEYKSLEKNITTELKKQYSAINGFVGVIVTGFRPGSVIADFVISTTQDSATQITQANKNLTNTLKSIAPVLKSSALYKSSSNIKYLTNPPFLTDTTMKLQCGPPDGDLLAIVGNVESAQWKVGNVNILSGTRQTFTTVSNTSILTVKNLIQKDAGLYECILKGTNSEFYQNRTVETTDIKAAPVLEMNPVLSVECKTDTKVPLDCCVQSPYTASLVQPPSNVNILGPTTSNGKYCVKYNYTITSCNSITFKCEVYQYKGYEKTTKLNFFIGAPTCKDNIFGDGQEGVTSKIVCPGGTKTAECKAGSWKVTEDNCILPIIKDLLTESTGLVQEKVVTFSSDLKKAVNDSKTEIGKSSKSVSTIVNIVNTIANVSTSVTTEVITNVLQTIDVLTDDSVKESWETLNKDRNDNAASKLLGSLEALSEALNGAADVSTPRIHLIRTNATEFKPPNSPVSLAIQDSDGFFNNDTFMTIIILNTFNNVMPARNSSYDLSLFNGTSNETSSANNANLTINAAVVLVRVNQTVPSVSFKFKALNENLTKETQCVFWNFTLFDNFGAWDDEGCKFVSRESDSIICNCSHLTSFSVLMSTDISLFVDDPSGSGSGGSSPGGEGGGQKPTLTEKGAILDIITYIGVGISLASLVICLIIEGYVWKAVTKNSTALMRHISIVNTALSLLIADICFIIAASYSQKALDNKDGDFKVLIGQCTAVTFFMHFFYLALFFWMLVSGLLLFYRTVMVFSHMSKSIMIAIGFVVGYGCPLIIAVTTVAATAPSQTYIRKNYICWLNWTESKALLSLVIPALIIVVINIIVVIVVLCKMMRRSSGNTVQPDEKNSFVVILRCLAILTPLFGLTWALGIGTMVSPNNFGIHVAFAFFNSLQGFFILVFGTLFDSKIRALLSSRMPSTNSNSTGSTSGGTTSLGGLVSRFRGRNVYQVSQPRRTGNTSSSSESYSMI